MKIMMLSDSPTIPTGYRNQNTQLAKYLISQGHEVIHLANGYMGTTIDSLKLEGGEEIPWKLIGHSGNDQYFCKSLSFYLRKFKPDWLFILLDTFMLYSAGFLNVDTAPAKTMFYFPSDGGGGMPKGCETILNKVDVPVAMARFGQKQCLDYYNINTLHIPHGLDSKSFYPLPDEDRKVLRTRWGFSDDDFVIGVVARNQPRKALDRTIKAMRLIADQNPNAKLFLHLDPHDMANQAFSIPELVKKYNLENRVFYSGMSAFQGFPQSEMNNVYNIMDCFLLTTTGEGFGIPIIEAMACGVPVVATDYTTTPELVLENEAGLGINLAGVGEVDMYSTHSKEYDFKKLDGTMTGSWEVERGMCSITHTAEQINKLYLDPKLRKKMGQNGRKAVLEKYDFNTVIGPSFEKIFKNE